MRVLKYLRGHIPAVALIVLLLVAQSFCELSLPAYTSRIVDTGIQSGGIEYAAPLALTDKTMDGVRLFLSDDDAAAVSAAYTDADGVWTINDTAQLPELEGIFIRPLVMYARLSEQGANTVLALRQQMQGGLITHEEILARGEEALSGMGTLTDSVLHSAAVQFLKTEYAVAGLNVVDDDLSRESAADGPVRIGLLQGVLDALDIVDAAVVVGRAEGNDQKLVLADLVLIAGIILGRIARVKTEILGARFLTLDHGLLLVGQRVPGSLGGLALGIGVGAALLHVDGVDQIGAVLSGHFVCISLVCAFSGCFGAYSLAFGGGTAGSHAVRWRTTASQQGGGQSQCGQHGSGLFQVVVFHVFCFLSPMANPFAEKQVQGTKPRRSSFADKTATKKRGSFCVQNGNAKRPPDFP